ncbi:MAG TPA: Uma2 family endonuclease [Phototrophicaceae bacterium]|nr:Uma2 family endonuclease [Phototrophicaceae bacterium]
MVVQKKLYTTAEFEAFIAQPENQDRLFELINGEIFEKMPTEKHGMIQAELAHLLISFSRPNKLGRVTTEVRHQAQGDEHNDLLPDVAFTSRERILPPVDEGAVPQMPDLAIEIQSPDDSLKKLLAKADQYLLHGSRMVLLILPQKRLIEVITADDVEILNENDTFDGGDVLPGFTLAVKDIFDIE